MALGASERMYMSSRRRVHLPERVLRSEVREDRHEWWHVGWSLRGQRHESTPDQLNTGMRFSVVALFLFLSIGVAGAFPPAVESACTSDAFRLCYAETMSKNEALIRGCMLRKRSMVSTMCTAAVKATYGLIGKRRGKR